MDDQFSHDSNHAAEDQGIDDRLAEFTDRLLADEEVAPLEAAAGDELAELQAIALLIQKTIPRRQPERSLAQRVHSRLAREWRQQTITTASQRPWQRWWRQWNWLPQRPANRRQTQRLALALAALLLVPLLALLFLQQYDGGRLVGTVLNGDEPAAYPGPLSGAALTRATNLHSGLLRQISRVEPDTQGNHNSWSATTTADGRFIAFTSLADNLTPNDNNNASDIFFYNGESGTITRISVGPNGEGNEDSFHPALSADGRFVAFASAANNFVDNDNNGVSDIFLYDMTNGSLRLISGGNGQSGNGASRSPAISADGRYVAFRSEATNLVANDNNNAADIFLFDRQTETIARVSVSDSGAEANGESHSPAISGDGRYVVFVSGATNLTAANSGHVENVYLRDRQAGTTRLISVGLNGQTADNHSATPTISQDGRTIAFQSSAGNLIENDHNNAADVFVYQLETGRITAVSVNNYGHLGNRSSGYPTLSADGRFVAFASFATNFSPISQFGFSNIYLHDRRQGVTEQISRSHDGQDADGSSVGATLSADGRYVLFDSVAANLLPSPDNGRVDVFRFDRMPETELTVNARSGQQGSYFILRGENFPPLETVKLFANGHLLGSIPVAADGRLEVTLDSGQANPGLYVTTAAVNLLETQVIFSIAPDAPHYPDSGDGPLLSIPAGIGLDNTLYLPAARR
jgi:Tol biopolymer transport system component